MGMNGWLVHKICVRCVWCKLVEIHYKKLVEFFKTPIV